jgi:hypothetical protein
VWIGPAPLGRDAWCERCQRGAFVPDGGEARCARCGGALESYDPGFEEFSGELQNLDAVLAAWAGDPAPLHRLLPERPRFLSDLDPPAPREGDPPAVVAALAALAAGAFAAAREQLEEVIAGGRGGAHLWRALAVAAERVGQPALAEAAWSRALEREEEPRSRLARGALRGRRGDFFGARADLALAGDRREARWNRAALALLEAVARTPGLPDRAVLEAARREAGEPSAYWSDHTVGRLLWTLLVERAAARARLDAPVCPDARVLRAAARELEFETFWDRALVLHGYAALALAAEAGEVAQPIARETLARARGAPWLAGAASAPIAAALEAAGRAIEAWEPSAARTALAATLAREDLRRYRIPCAACGRGAFGVVEVEESGGPE